ncbi:MAG: TetR/AcrR family transcriptional regulator [Acetivibrio ethanolgignens]
MEKKMTNRAKQALATKEKIYKTAIGLFKKEGYRNVSVNQIAKEAGVGVGTFYHYYESKMQLFMEIFVHAEDYLEEFRDIDMESREPKELIQQYFYQYARLNENAGIEFAQSMTSIENRKFLGDNKDFEKTFTKIIEYYQNRRRIEKTDSAEQISQFFFLVARGVLFDWSVMANGGYALTEKMEDVMKYIINIYVK